jgi:hypothetical protein
VERELKNISSERNLKLDETKLPDLCRRFGCPFMYGLFKDSAIEQTV